MSHEVNEGHLPSRTALMAEIKKYWVTASGEPELGEFADYVRTLIKSHSEAYAAEKVKEALDELATPPRFKRSSLSSTKAKELYDQGYSYGKVARLMGVGKSTAQYWINAQLTNKTPKVDP